MGGQTIQLLAARDDWYFPASHRRQRELLLFIAYVPSKHAAGSVEPSAHE
jgi:hypothetical protein